MNKYLLKSLLALLGISIVITAQPLDLTDQISPMFIIPNQQEGYGAGKRQLAQPNDLEILLDGSLLISDMKNNRIQYFSAKQALKKSITAWQLNLDNFEIIPTGIARDDSGFIYISLEGAGKIIRFTPQLQFDQFIGTPCEISAEEYYKQKNQTCLINPQGIIVSNRGDVFVIDMAKEVFTEGKKQNFGFKKFRKIIDSGITHYIFDQDFAKTQEITTIMRSSEGMAISESQELLFIAEEKPEKKVFGNKHKKCFIAVFDLATGKFKNRLIGVSKRKGKIINGYFDDSVRGLCVQDSLLFAVAGKQGQVYVFNINTGEALAKWGTPAPYYCDAKSKCKFDGINYNEPSIITGEALPHLMNNWEKNELASPNAVSVTQFKDGRRRLAVIDQWNSRILVYNLDLIYSLID